MAHLILEIFLTKISQLDANNQQPNGSSIFISHLMVVMRHKVELMHGNNSRIVILM